MTDFPELRERINEHLHRHLDECDAPPRLQEAMRYSVLNGGKRIRAQLVYLGAQVFGIDPELADTPAAAIELVHAYSLVHDDLPAMDNDDYRRGKQSCHVKFGEATAILVGDALQSLGFQILTEAGNLNHEIRLQLVRGLARAIGGSGMVAGQLYDLIYEDKCINRQQLESMHLLKTGALISQAASFGGIIAGADRGTQAILEKFGNTLGLAFQVQDDILDFIGDNSAIGKPTGSDVVNNKSTFVTMLGLDVARQTLQDLLEVAKSSIDPLGPNARSLKQLADFVAARDH